MKHIPLVLLIISVGVSSCTKTRTIKNEQFNYEITFPEDWTAENKQVYVDIFAPLDLSEKQGRESVSISTDRTSGMSLEACFKTYVTDWYQEQHQNFTIIARGTAMLNGRNANWIECQYQQAGILMTHLIYLTIHGDRFFMIVGQSRTERFPKYKKPFEEIIKSFRAN